MGRLVYIYVGYPAPCPRSNHLVFRGLASKGTAQGDTTLRHESPERAFGQRWGRGR
jgi:hypothetical protein